MTDGINAERGPLGPGWATGPTLVEGGSAARSRNVRVVENARRPVELAPTANTPAASTLITPVMMLAAPEAVMVKRPLAGTFTIVTE